MLDSGTPSDIPERPDLDPRFVMFYEEIRRLARRHMASERTDHTLSPTALVNEAYLKLRRDRKQFENASQVKALAARAMRRVLINHANRKNAAKRGAGVEHVPLATGILAQSIGPNPLDAVALENALRKLETDVPTGPRKVRMVELLFFGGLSLSEAASVLGVAERTIERDWLYTRAFLTRELGG